MPYYDYEARAKGGKLVKSQAFATNRQELVKLLQGQGLMIISMKEATAIAEKHAARRHRRAKSMDLMLFSKELSILLENGVAMIEALDVTTKQLESTDLIAAIKAIRKDLESGATFRNALAKHPKTFSSFWLDMVEAGELSGQLPYVLKQVCVFIESREDIKKKTINAFLYPGLLLVLAVIVVFVFAFKVVPIFKGLFATFGSKLPPLTQTIFNASDILRRYFIFIIGGLIVIVFLIKRGLSTKPGRRFYENILLKIPVVGGLFLALAIERFASTLGVLLKSGIPIIKALEVSAKASQSAIFAERIEEAKMKVTGGLPFSEAIQQSSLFPPLTVQLLLVAEKTGNYSGMLEEVSKYYADVIDLAITRFTALVGPIVLIFMTMIIGGVVVAMFLPIFKIATL